MQSNMNPRGDRRERVQDTCVMTFAPKWQNCTAKEYYSINRILLLCIGLWPYQNSSSRNIIITFMTVLFISSIVFQLTTFVTTEYNGDLLLEVLSFSIPWLAYMLKYNALCLNIKKIRGLMEQVWYDWNALSNAQEIEIIKKYSALGRFITLITTLFIYMSIFIATIMQLLSNFLPDITTTVNQSRLRRLPIKTEYFIDEQKYFVSISLHILLFVMGGLTTVVATETLYMSYTQHTCGLFQIASFRIEQALHKNMIQNVTSSAERSLIVCEGIISAVIMYRRANKFLEMSKATFKWAYTLLLPLGVLSLSINLYRFTQLIITDRYYDLIVNILFIFGHFWYMLFTNYFGQEIIDHSGNIFYKTCNSRWYEAPLKAQKLLLFVMQRSMQHSTITIVGLFVVSFEGFATLTSMSISYFTMIFSTQGSS